MYEEVAFKFLENFIWISYAMDKAGEQRDDMWDEQDGFYYDVLRLPDGDAFRLKVRSMVGLLPLCASTVFEGDIATRHPKLVELIALFRKRHPEVVAHVAPTIDGFIGHAGRRLLSPLTRAKLERILSYLLDENEFLGPYGIRSLSRHHLDHPFVFQTGGQEHRVQYLPAESNTGMFGGNSNWRGPVWMPVNVLLIRGLLNLYGFYGDDLKVECPTGSGNRMTLFEVAKEISRRLSAIFLRDASGRRPVYGGSAKFQDDPHWRDLILFYEYFHGDNGAGLGASHQTGWTGLVARLLDLFGRVTAEDCARRAPRTGSMPAWSGSRWAASRRPSGPKERPCPTARSGGFLGGLALAAAVASVRRHGPGGGGHGRRRRPVLLAAAYTYLLPDDSDVRAADVHGGPRSARSGSALQLRGPRHRLGLDRLQLQLRQEGHPRSHPRSSAASSATPTASRRATRPRSPGASSSSAARANTCSTSETRRRASSTPGREPARGRWTGSASVWSSSAPRSTRPIRHSTRLPGGCRLQERDLHHLRLQSRRQPARPWC